MWHVVDIGAMVAGIEFVAKFQVVVKEPVLGI